MSSKGQLKSENERLRAETERLMVENEQISQTENDKWRMAYLKLEAEIERLRRRVSDLEKYPKDLT